MKYCEKCGKEIHDEAAPAPAPVANDMAENPKTARFALGFAFLCPIVGLIFGIKGIKQYASNKKLKTQCIIAIPLSIILSFVWGALLFGGLG